MEVFTEVMKLDSIGIVNQIGETRQNKINIFLQQNTEQTVPNRVYMPFSVFHYSLPYRWILIMISLLKTIMDFTFKGHAFRRNSCAVINPLPSKLPFFPLPSIL